MGRKQEKGKKGEAVQYYSRKQALRYLQIGLPNFIRLCLWKSIYPSEPNNLKAAGKGDTRPKIYYKRKDIKTLLQEPIVEKLREIRAFSIQLKRAKERKDKDKVYRLRKSKPRYTLHHIVKELYPSREDALSHLDDCLKSVFIFASLPKMTQFNGAHIMKCKRLKLEFMNFCITKQALRKCFVSVKGYYLEVEICGISVRWVAPLQHVAMSVPVSPDYRMLANQVEFDCVLLESLLLNLYTESGLIYPPKFAVDETNDWNENDILASMAFPLLKAQCDSETDADQLALSEFRDMDDELTAVVEKQEKISAIQSLFRDKKIFLNREIPREFFCFLLRCCGATEVSWDWAVATGATFGVDDNTIQYHVLDRPLELASTHINRFYVQPQFVIDSINAGRLLPVKDYLPGMKLIPHLSPFADYTKGYVPPEYRYLKGELDAEQLYADVDSEQDGDEEAVEEIDEEESELDDESDEEEEDCLYEEDEMEVEQQPVKATKKPARINRGKYKEQVEARKEIKLREIDLPRKRRNLYNKMKHAEKKEKSTVENLKQKRKAVNKKRMSSKK